MLILSAERFEAVKFPIRYALGISSYRSSTCSHTGHEGRTSLASHEGRAGRTIVESL
jgi:hypothetical protein